MKYRELPPLAPLLAFEAAARRSSFKLAAGELAVTPGAVSQQIKRLEEVLGTALFHRRTRATQAKDREGPGEVRRQGSRAGFR